MSDLSRRTIIKVTSAFGATMLPVASVTNRASAQAQHEHSHNHGPSSVAAATTGASQQATYTFFNSEEADFIEAAVARLIPKNEWDGALEAGVPNYIDKQLGGAWGAGERLYRSGPWQPGTPSQGYQLQFTPAELFRTAIRAINNELSGTPFAKLSPDEQDSYLKSLEAGGKNLGGVPSEVFFAHLLESTLEGFFSDPVYGGTATWSPGA
jgi:gluconate 2-dehydrogenase gamma chain